VVISKKGRASSATFTVAGSVFAVGIERISAALADDQLN